jgi:hypothetical protein
MYQSHCVTPCSRELSIRNQLSVFAACQGTDNSYSSHALALVSKPRTRRKTIRVFWVSLALVARLVIATSVLSNWQHANSTNDAHCPSCHLGHQLLIQSIAPNGDKVLKSVALLHLLEEVGVAMDPFFADRPARTLRRVTSPVR